MKILITGAAGFIGSNLARHLANSTDAHILALDKLTYAGNRSSILDLERDARFTFQIADICDAAAMREAFAAFQPTAVMHLAAESHVDRSIDGPSAFIQTNLVGTFELLQAARTHYENLPPAARDAFRFLHISTDEVYGSLGLHAAPFQETTAYDPHSPYSASKAGSDHLARAWHTTYGLPVIVTNCSNNYGPFQFPEKLIPLAILKALRGESIPVYGRGENVRDWLYVLDHANALAAVLAGGVPGATYNIGGDSERSNLELVEQLCQILDELRPRADGASYAKQITFVADRPGHDLRYAINADKINKELGWKPSESLTSGLYKTVHWYLNHDSWWKAILCGKHQLQRQGARHA